MNNNLLLLILISIVFFSCRTTKTFKPKSIYLFQVNAENSQESDDYLFIENEIIRVVYIFWSENGTMGILIQNKSNKPIYIDWKKCSLIVGMEKNDYWDESITVSSISKRDEIGYANLYQLFFKNRSNSFSNYFNHEFFNSVSVLNKVERITFITPGATISNNKYKILNNNNIINNWTDFSIKDTSVYVKGYIKVIDDYNQEYINKPGLQNFELQYKDYSIHSSPYKFRSFITYSMDEDFSDEHYVNTQFYISKIYKMDESLFRNARRDKATLDDKNYNMWALPNLFYSNN